LQKKHPGDEAEGIQQTMIWSSGKKGHGFFVRKRGACKSREIRTCKVPGLSRAE